MNRRALLHALLLGATGFVLNLFAIPLLPGIHLLLGDVPALLAAFAYGPLAGLVAGTIAASRTLTLWGHPYGWLLLGLQPVAVGLLRHRMRPVFSIALYWLLVGFPAGVLTYVGIMGVAWPVWGVVLAKQPLNGLINALVAEALLLARPVRARIGLHGSPPVRQYLGVVAALATGIPLVTLWVFNTRTRWEAEVEHATREAVVTTRSLAEVLEREPPAPVADRLSTAPPPVAAEYPGARVHVATAEGVPVASSDAGVWAERAPAREDPVFRLAHEIATEEAVATTVLAQQVRQSRVEIIHQFERTLVAARRSPGGLVVWTEVPLQGVAATMAGAVLVGELMAIGALLAALTLAILVARRVEGPLDRLVGATRALGRGELSARAGIDALAHAPAELAALAESFDDMARQLERAQGEARRALHEVQQAALARERFFAAAAHDLRTPLGAIMGHADILGLEVHGELTAAQRETIERIHDNADHLLDLLTDLLDVSRLAAGRIEVHPEPADLAVLVDESAEAVRPRARQKGLELDLRGHPPPDQVVVDPLRFKQILINLLGNAVKFTDEGSVTVHWGAAEDGWYRVAVIDTGPGISPELQDQIFQEFEQTALGRAHGGTGLGLAISRRLARLMGGDLELESEVGRGSTFTLRLPVAGPAPAGRGERPEHERSTAHTGGEHG